MNQSQQVPLLFSGSCHPALAEEVATFLGLELGKVAIERFPDGEISLQIQESVRGRDIFVVQSVALNPNYFLMELLVMIDALKRASARSIVAVIPYFGYCRQDRKDKARVPITAKLVANMLVTAGVTRVLTMDLHSMQVQGFFDCPVNNLHGRVVLIPAVKALGLRDLVVVTPDVGSIKLARDIANQLGVEFAIVDKDRINASHVAVTTVIGDVAGRDVLLADDMCSTAGTMLSAAKACREKGARKIVAAVSHGLFVGSSLERIEQGPVDLVLYCNTIPADGRLASATKLRSVSVASLFGRAIRCMLSAESIYNLLELSSC